MTDTIQGVKEQLQLFVKAKGNYLNYTLEAKDVDRLTSMYKKNDPARHAANVSKSIGDPSKATRRAIAAVQIGQRLKVDEETVVAVAGEFLLRAQQLSGVTPMDLLLAEV